MTITGFFTTIDPWKEQVMKHEPAMERRQFLKGALGIASLVAIAGCDDLMQREQVSQETVKRETYSALTVNTRTGGRELELPYEKPVILPVADNHDPAVHAWADARFA